MNCDTRVQEYKKKTNQRIMVLVFSIVCIAFGRAERSDAQTLNILQNLGSVNVSGPLCEISDAGPLGHLTRDSAGNFYGVSAIGGSYSGGSVYELVNSSGTYTEKPLFAFGCYPGDSKNPNAGLAMDPSGNLFGTTSLGGAYNGSYGTVFEMVYSSGKYTENVIYSFGASSTDGRYPHSDLMIDADGNLYGTTVGGGDFGQGTVFELVNTSGNYSEKVLYSFTGSSSTPLDGSEPYAGLLMDAGHNLYGTTLQGGEYGQGTVFELVYSSGQYSERILHSFAGIPIDGALPTSGLVMDASGNLYGTTGNGGTSDHGTVFEMVNSSGSYSEFLLHSFSPTDQIGGDGARPTESLVMDPAGDLFGTTDSGGSFEAGIVFEMAKTPNGFTEKILHSFEAFPGDGRNPQSDLLLDSSGNIYGSAYENPDFRTPNSYGGAGIVFEINPNVMSPTVRLSTYSLDFASVLVGTTSPPQSVTVINSGSGDLIFGNVATNFTGDYPGDFGTSSDMCSGSTVPANSTCSVDVTFTPKAVNIVEKAAVGLVDNALNNTQQTVNLSGAGNPTGNFALAPTPGTQSTVTVNAGGTATYSITVAPQSGFNFSVSMGCGGYPSLGSCTIAPSSIKLDGVNSQTAILTVTTKAPVSRSLLGGPPYSGPLPSSLLWVLSGLFAAFALHRARSLPAIRSFRLRVAVNLAVIAIIAISFASCGGGTPIQPVYHLPGTPPGTYTITVSGDCGNLTNLTTVTLVVN